MILAVDASSFEQSLQLVPAVRALRTVYPNSYLVAATATGTCQLLGEARLVQETIDLGLLAETSAFGASASFKLFRHVRRLPIDLFIDFNPSLGTQLFARVLLRTRTIAAITPADVIDAMIGRSLSLPRARERYLATLDRLDVSASGLKLCPPSRPEDNERFERFLSDSGFKGAEPLVLLYSRHHRHGWSVPMFADLSNRLANNFGVRVVAADEPGSIWFTAAAAPFLPGGAIWLAQPDALQFVAGIARSTVVVTDSAAASSIASELGTPRIDPTGKTVEDVHGLVSEEIRASRSESLFRR